MGLMDTIKGLFSGGATAGFVDKVISLSEGEIVARAKAELAGMAEDEAKGTLKAIAADIMRGKLREIEDPTGMVNKLGDQIVDKASEKVVDKVWDRVKDQIKKAA